MKSSIGTDTPESLTDGDHDGSADRAEQDFAHDGEPDPAAGQRISRRERPAKELDPADGSDAPGPAPVTPPDGN